MKKIIFCLLVLLTALLLLACDYIVDDQQDVLRGVRGTGNPPQNRNEITNNQPEDPNNDSCPYRWAVYDEGHSLIMLCDCCAAPAVVEPHENVDTDNFCDVCGYEMSVYPDDIAQIVIDYEESLKSEINKLNEENSEYTYFYCPVDRIWCVFMLENSASAENIVAKHDMHNVFSGVEVNPYESFKMIDMYVDKNDFTESMHEKIKQIADDEPLIQRYFIEMESDIVKSYMPKIEHYADDAIEVSYQIANNAIYSSSYDNSFIIKSKEEYDNYLNNLLEATEYEFLIEHITAQKDLYDETFFEENALIITKKIVRSSGSINLTVNNLYISDNKVYVVVRTDEPGMRTDDMQERTFTLEVPKSEVINVDEVITLE